MEVVCCPARISSTRQYGIEVGVMHICWPSKNRFTAQRYDRGDNLSVRFHIQNSISLTIAMPPRII